MRCPACNAEVGEAKRCPYCNHRLNGRSGRFEGESRVRGEFRGRLDETDTHRKSSLLRSLLNTVLRFLGDPHIGPRAKLLFILGALYILMPLDFLPGGLIPVIGWLDDLIVAFLVWTLIGPDLKRHYRP